MARDCTQSTPLLESHQRYQPNIGLSGRDAYSGEGGTITLEGILTATNYHRYRAFNKELRAHLSHISHLIIAGTDEISNTLSMTLLQHTLVASPAPILEYLSLSNFYDILGPLSIPDHVFKGITPRLSFLQLDHIDISWKSSLLRGLRYLEISGIGQA